MEYLSEIISFIIGAGAGSLLTFTVVRNRASGGGRVVDQSRSKANGDIVGGNKS